MAAEPDDGALTPLAVARDRLVALARPLARETVPLGEALGRIAAVDLVAAAACPAADLALTDGWAVAAADTVGASPYAPAFLADPRPIRFGAALPTGTDAVLPTVAGREEAGLLIAESALAPGENTRRRGTDLARGALLVAAGRPIDAAAIALARLSGLSEAEVTIPTVALRAAPSPVADLAAALLEGIGCRVVLGGPQTPFAAETSLAIDLADAPTPRGEVVVAGLALTGAERVTIENRDGAVVIVLPDRFEILLAVLETLVAPVLARLGAGPAIAETVTRPLARKLASRVGFSEIALLAVDEVGRWVPLAVGDATWAAWIRADALLVLPPESEGSAEATPTTARPPLLRP